MMEQDKSVQVRREKEEMEKEMHKILKQMTEISLKNESL
jgi:ribosomal protein S17